ncbi:unnamed protein product [Brassica rapa subsp. narinosa]
MFRQGWDPGEQMVSGDKGRVDLHYYDGTGSEIDERKQKEGFSIKNLLDLRRQCRKFGKSRWSRQIESEKSLVSFRIGEFSSIFFQSLDLDGTILVLIKTKSKDLVFLFYRLISSLSIYLCFSFEFYCQYVGFCFIARCCLKALWNKTGLLGVCFYCEIVYLGKNFFWFGDQWGKLCVAGSHKLTGLYGFFGNTLLSVLFTTHMLQLVSLNQMQCLSRYSVMTGVRWSLPWWNLELRRCCVRGSVIYLLPPVLYTYIYSFIRASKHEGIVCVLWSRDGTRKTMWPVSSWVDEVLNNFLNFMVLLRIMGHEGHILEGDLRWSGHGTLNEYAGEQVTLCVSYSQTLLMFGTCLHVGERDITVSKALGFDSVGSTGYHYTRVFSSYEHNQSFLILPLFLKDAYSISLRGSVMESNGYWKEKILPLYRMYGQLLYDCMDIMRIGRQVQVLTVKHKYKSLMGMELLEYIICLLTIIWWWLRFQGSFKPNLRSSSEPNRRLYNEST